MEIIDLQLHEPGPRSFWKTQSPQLGREAMKEALYQMTDAVGVDGVVLHPERDLTLCDEVARDDPRRFSTVPQLIDRAPEGDSWGAIRDSSAPDLADQVAREFERPGVVGFRFTIGEGRSKKFAAGGYDQLLRACESVNAPIMLLATGYLEVAETIASRYDGLQIIIDHFGLPQPPMRTPDVPPWRELPGVIALADHPNVAVKMCGAPSLSAQGYPFADAWEHVARVIDAFGIERVAWGSDIGRFRGVMGWESHPEGIAPYPGKHTYMESLAFFLYNDHLTDPEKERILGTNTRALLRWP